MAKPTLAKSLVTMINGEANNNPAPIACEVIKNYDDPNIVDVTTDEGTYDYVPCILSNKIGNIGILIFIDGDPDSPFAIIDNR